ncbi:MAG: M48 family metallopeptidase [Candidatus Bipolaricaulota bacterium]
MKKKEKLKEYGFDLESYEKARNYELESLSVDIVDSLISLGILAVFIFFGTEPLFNFLRGSVGNIWAVRILYILIFSGGFFFLNIPTGLVSFRIEHKYGLSNQDLLGWTKDQLKGLAINLVLSLVGFSLLFWVLNATEYWWLWAWVAATAITIFLQFIAPTVLMPLFYEFEPIDDEELKRRLERLADRAGVDILGAFNMKASEKTEKGIGALAGIGSSRRIILSDTMIENYSREEIEAVMAHEMGHHKYHDIWILLFVQSLFTLLGFFLIATYFSPITEFFNLGPNISTLPIILGLMELVLFTLSPIRNGLSRMRERVADDFSLRLVETPEALGEALVKLSQQNLGNPAPSKLIEFLFYDHPAGLKRVKKAFKYKDN